MPVDFSHISKKSHYDSSPDNSAASGRSSVILEGPIYAFESLHLTAETSPGAKPP
jgi:hypothetical protein